MLFARIHDIECYLPPDTVTNEQLAKEYPEWDLDGIFAKTGVRARRICSTDHTALDMAEKATQILLNRNSGFSGKIDYLIYCTQSPDHFLPSGACILQSRLNLSINTAAFDFNLGCSGYIYGLALSKSLIVSEMAKNILLVTGDVYSRYIHPADRTNRVLFGDAASATLVVSEKNGGKGLGNFLLRTDGKGAKNLIVPAGALRLPSSIETAVETTDSVGCVRSQDNLFMDGTEIFTFAMLRVPQILKELLAVSKLDIDDVNWFVYHQANKFMLDKLMTRSRIPEKKMVRNYELIGNSVSTSIPLALQEYIERDYIKKGHRLILVGFGVGYSWGACDLVL